ncbi:MAG: hypothetical protein WC959_08250 [Kiritimatiellales bacterium]
MQHLLFVLFLFFNVSVSAADVLFEDDFSGRKEGATLTGTPVQQGVVTRRYEGGKSSSFVYGNGFITTAVASEVNCNSSFRFKASDIPSKHTVLLLETAANPAGLKKTLQIGLSSKVEHSTFGYKGDLFWSLSTRGDDVVYQLRCVNDTGLVNIPGTWGTIKGGADKMYRLEYNLADKTITAKADNLTVLENYPLASLSFTPELQSIRWVVIGADTDTNGSELISSFRLTSALKPLISEPVSTDAKNLMPNGTFNAGNFGWWPESKDLESSMAVTSDTPDGNAYLRLTPKDNRANNLFVRSSWVKGGGSKLFLKFRVRGDAATGTVSLGGIPSGKAIYETQLAQQINLNSEWQWYAFEFDAPRFYLDQLQLVFSASGVMDIDDVMLGTRAFEEQEFIPFAPVEASLESTQLASIFFTNEMPRFILRASNYQAGNAASTKLSYTVTDYYDQEVLANGKTVALNGRLSETIDLPVSVPGYYRVKWDLGGAATGATAFVVAAPPRRPVDPRFSMVMVESNPRNQTVAAARMGAGGLRLHGYGFQWRNLQPTPDAWNVNRDMLAYFKQETAAELMALVYGPPPSWVPKDENYQFNVPVAVEMVKRVVADTKDLISDYEIYNEPNGNFPGTMEEYAEYLAKVYDVIKAQAPDRNVVGMCTSQIALGYMESVLGYGAAGKMDVLSFHPYRLTSAEITSLEDEIAAVRRLTENASFSPALWATEVGYRCDDGFLPMKPSRFPGVRLFSEAAAARYMAKLNLMLMANHVDRTYWFMPSGIGGAPNPFYYGFYYENAEHMIPKKIVAAFCAISRALNGLPFAERIETGDHALHLLRFGAENGKQVLVAFRNENSVDPRYLTLRSPNALACTDIAGAPLNTVNRTGDATVIEVGIEPIYIEFNADNPVTPEFPLVVTSEPEQVLDGSTFTMAFDVRNIFAHPATFTITPEFPAGWICEPSAPAPLPLDAGASAALTFTVTVPADNGTLGEENTAMFRIAVAEAPAANYVVERKLPFMLRKYLNRDPLTIKAADWQWAATPNDGVWKAVPAGNAVKFSYKFGTRVYGNFTATMTDADDFGGFSKLLLDIEFDDPSTFTFSVILKERNGSLYRSVPQLEHETKGKRQIVTVRLPADFTPLGGWGAPDDNGRLDLNKIREVTLQGNSPADTEGSFTVHSLTFTN